MVKTTEELLEDKSKYDKLGDKIISVRMLKRNKVSLRTKSLTQANVPTKVVSNDIRNLLLEYLHTGKFNYRNFETFDDKDKQLVAEIFYQAGLDYELGINYADEYVKDLDRFELLKGQLLAGNDSKEIFREMKVIILRLLAGGRITRSKANTLLYDLVVLSEY